MAATSSVPVKLLHEAEGHDVTIELKSGELYRGRLLAAEETMNVQLSSVVHQARDGRVTRHVVIYLCATEGLPRARPFAVYLVRFTVGSQDKCMTCALAAYSRCRLEHVYLRGNHIRFVVLPEILLNAPLFK